MKAKAEAEHDPNQQQLQVLDLREFSPGSDQLDYMILYQLTGERIEGNRYNYSLSDVDQAMDDEEIDDSDSEEQSRPSIKISDLSFERDSNQSYKPVAVYN